MERNTEIKKRIAKITLVFMLVFCLIVTVCPINAENSMAASSKITTSGITKPKDIKQGSSFVIKGTIKSKLTISKVEIGVTNSAGSAWVSGMKYTNKKVKAKSFNIFKADKSIKFGSLAAGTYYYRIWVHDANGAHMILNHNFNVIKPISSSTPSSLKDKFVAQALSYEGKPASYFGFSGAWCAKFISYCSKKAGADSKINANMTTAYDISKDTVDNKGGLITFVDSECYNERVSERMFNSPRVYYNASYAPRKGDLLIVFNSSKTNDGKYYHHTFRHIGIVYADDSYWQDGFSTIEGNMGNKVTKYTKRGTFSGERIGAFVTPAW